MAITAATTERRRARAAGPDRLTVVMLTVAAFLTVLALLTWQLRATPGSRTDPLIVHRRVYETRIVETLVGPARGGSSVTQSVSSSGAAASAPAAATRVS
jgi:hypothetical protein